MTCSYFGQDVGWVENPGKAGAPWTYHEVDQPGNIEAAWVVDLSGDGVPDILPNTVNVVVWYEVVKKGDGKGYELKKHDFGNEAAGHGVGSGDVNGDGRVDLLTPKGWFEAPSDPSHDTWTWHPEWKIGATGIQILARDVDGDGLSDVVYGMGHDYGLFWLHQGKGTGGERTWTKQAIDKTIASVHTLLWADIDGDGKADELVTGKRVYAHEIEPGATDGSVIAWYEFDPGSKEWARHVIFQGEPARNAPAKAGDRLALKDFPPGTAGTGLQITAVDIDKDGDIDLVCPGKSGLYLFENLRCRSDDRGMRAIGSVKSGSTGSRLRRRSRPDPRRIRGFDLFGDPIRSPESIPSGPLTPGLTSADSRSRENARDPSPHPRFNDP